jgi:hypothetical protein
MVAGAIQQTGLRASHRNVIGKLFDSLVQHSLGLAVVSGSLRRAGLIQQRAGTLRKREIP